MKEFSTSDKIKAFIATKITDLFTLLDNNIKLAVYTGGNLRGLYHYLEIIGALTTLTTSVQSYHNFGPSYSSNKDT